MDSSLRWNDKSITMAIIRAATEQDIPRLLELYRQLSFHPGDYKIPPLNDCQKTLEEMSRVPGYSLLVAEVDGKVAGTTVLAILPGMAHGTSSFAVIEYVVVDEKLRSQGIGKLMMEHCMARAKEAGCYKIILTSDKKRERAHRFYESLGFEASAHGFRYYF
jgi:ribosomal protein S18 acetylase RimI-like enzyme